MYPPPRHHLPNLFAPFPYPACGNPQTGKVVSGEGGAAGCSPVPSTRRGARRGLSRLSPPFWARRLRAARPLIFKSGHPKSQFGQSFFPVELGPGSFVPSEGAKIRARVLSGSVNPRKVPSSGCWEMAASLLQGEELEKALLAYVVSLDSAPDPAMAAAELFAKGIGMDPYHEANRLQPPI